MANAILVPAERLVDIERARPGVGREWIRTWLAKLRAEEELKCEGKGRLLGGVWCVREAAGHFLGCPYR